jgi:hypothetical protein
MHPIVLLAAASLLEKVKRTAAGQARLLKAAGLLQVPMGSSFQALLVRLAPLSLPMRCATSMQPWTRWVLIAGLVLWQALAVTKPGLGQNSSPTLDVLELRYEKKGPTQLEGRLLCVTDPQEIWIEDRRGVQRVPREGVLSLKVDSRRARLADWMALRQVGQTAEQAFALVAAADTRGLKAMARLQAMEVLLLDGDHVGAHQYLGHKLDKRSGRYRWPLRDGKPLATNAYLEWVLSSWERRVVLESEHYLLETDCGLAVALNALFDLERLYLFWMQTVGAELWAFEDVFQPERRRMAWRVFKDRFQPGYNLLVATDRAPEYDPTQATEEQFVAHEGWRQSSSNLVYSYLPAGSLQPAEFFELGVTQLLTSTLLLGNPEACDPPEPGPGQPIPRYSAVPMWAELGLSAYLGRQFGGPPGFATYRSDQILLTSDEIYQARSRVGQTSPSPLSLAKAEITNLIGLPYPYFRAIQPGSPGTVSDWHRAKARAWGVYLLDQRPTPPQAERSARTAFLAYLRDSLRTGRGPSSNLLDESFGGPSQRVHIEDLEAPFFAWLDSL